MLSDTLSGPSQAIETWFMGLQDEICRGLEELDGSGKTFETDLWQRAEGGGGRTRIFQEGNFLEKGGVAFSAVHGPSSEQMLRSLQIPHEAGQPLPDFLATGVSIVLHPRSPEVPIIHMNVRYFELSNGVWWFGGGIDLTPHYIDQALAQRFHEGLHAVCQKHDASYYPRFKTWADEYFFLKHRQETRGVGGIFFDRMSSQSEGKSKAEIWAFVQDVGQAFVPLYAEQVNATRQRTHGEQEKAWQFLRRGRYVEFNLVWDRGTQFGLHSGGRTESILMSLPPQANWAYNYSPEIGTREAATLKLLRKDLDWLKGGI